MRRGIPSIAKPVRIKPKTRPQYPSNWKEISSEFRNSGYGNRCEDCFCIGTKANPIQAHHTLRVAAKGRSDKIFLKKLCSKCHSKKHGRDLTPKKRK
jgi:hypothetical protein